MYHRVATFRRVARLRFFQVLKPLRPYLSEKYIRRGLKNVSVGGVGGLHRMCNYTILFHVWHYNCLSWKSKVLKNISLGLGFQCICILFLEFLTRCYPSNRCISSTPCCNHAIFSGAFLTFSIFLTHISRVMTKKKMISFKHALYYAIWIILILNYTTSGNLVLNKTRLKFIFVQI